MDEGLLASIIGLLAVLILVGAIAYAIYRVRARAREVAQVAFGTDSLLEGFQDMQSEVEKTPKSISSATSLYLPQIHRDFPEFNFADMRVRAENVLTSYLMAIDAHDATLLSEGSRELREALKLYLSSLDDAGMRESFDHVKVHRSEISRYEKRNGRCVVTFQSAAQAKHARRDRDGNVVAGNPDGLEQMRFDVELVYIQDQNKVLDDRERADAVNCPNCGAPVTSLGAKTCAYCGSAIEPYNIRVWAFHKVEQS